MKFPDNMPKDNMPKHRHILHIYLLILTSLKTTRCQYINQISYQGILQLSPITDYKRINSKERLCLLAIYCIFQTSIMIIVVPQGHSSHANQESNQQQRKGVNHQCIDFKHSYTLIHQSE